MWRALFLAGGIYMCVLGGECLVVDKFVMAAEQPRPQVEAAPPATFFGSAAAPGMTQREITPPEWAPWSFLSAGAVIILYALTINRAG